MLKTAIVILNYNGKHYLEEFLPFVEKYSPKNAKIIIADNASTDDSIIYLQNHHPSVTIIPLASNLGYSHGYNEALKQVEAEYFVLLNSDVEVTKDWLQPLTKLLDEDPSIAACQPKILSYHKRHCFEYAGAAGGFIDFLGYPFCRGRIFDHVERDTGQYDDTIPIFWATGACLAIRSTVFRELGGFDEDFFAHMEEIDLCWRIRLNGHQIFYVGESAVYHVGGGTLPQTSPRKTYFNFRNGLSMLYKNTDSPLIYLILPLRIALDFVAAVKFLFSNSMENSKAIMSGIADFAKRYNLNKKKKKSINFQKYSFIKEIYSHSIVMEFFIKKNKTFKELNF